MINDNDKIANVSRIKSYFDAKKSVKIPFGTSSKYGEPGIISLILFPELQSLLTRLLGVLLPQRQPLQA